ncbi:MAG: hypothetical protein DWQ31_19470 [Planctomycetota bacterium]|nr:MAG: hypothetical protein DWQ31_19470 [Planctomycetota bacterium]
MTNVSNPSEPTNEGFASSILRQPLLWGVLASALFYAAIQTGQLQHPLLTRYFASHPVEYIATTMFFVGLAALLMRYFYLAGQARVPRESLLGPPRGEPVGAEGASIFLEALAQQRRAVQNGLLGRRLRAVLQTIQQRQGAEHYEKDLEQLAEAADAESHRSYSLVRILSSTIPILGFLGTVIGLTKAVAELSIQVGEVGLEEAIEPVIAGLSVAFDTTALALGLSIVLVFAMYFVNRRESQLLADVERRAREELLGRFITDPTLHDPQLLALRRMCDQVVTASEKLVERQSELWERTINAAHERWSTLSVTTERQIETSLSRALKESYAAHVEHLEQSAEAAARRTTEPWNQAVAALQQTSASLQNQQTELRRQGEVMLQAVDATGRVLKLEDALNKNLATLAESRNFEQAVASLAAAVNLFSTKATHESPVPPTTLRSSSSSGRAA